MTGLGVLAAEKFWILDPLYNSLGTLLAWFYGIVPSYGVAIMLLTVAVRIITLPLTAKQARSQQQMQRVAPELKRLQAKYKHDKQKLNEEMMRFYKENHVNPLGGCLPVLIQAPVLIVLYRLILDLTAKPDPKHIPRSSALFESLKESAGTMVSWGIDLAQSAAEVSGSDKFPYLVLVAAVVATGYFQQKQLTARVSKENVNPQMAMMTKIFPVMFGFISFTIPAGVVVYFLVSNIWQIGQQAVLFRNQPVPEPAKDTAKDGADKPAKSGKPSSGAKGRAAVPPAKGRAAVPPAKGKGTGSKGPKGGSPRPGAGKGGAKASSGKRPAGAGPPKGRGGPPARSGAKGAGKATPGNRPSGRVTPPKRGQSPGKGKPAVKGATPPRSGPRGRAGGVDTGDAGQAQRWWQKLRPATTPAPPPPSDGGRPSTGAPPTKAGGGARPKPKPKPKTGAAKGTAGGGGPSAPGRPKPKVGTPAKGPTADPAPPSAPPGPAGAPSASGNGQTVRAASESDSPPVTPTNPPATNGSGDARAQSGDAAAAPAEAAPGTGGEGLNPDGEPGTRLPDEVQGGDE